MAPVWKGVVNGRSTAYKLQQNHTKTIHITPICQWIRLPISASTNSFQVIFMASTTLKTQISFRCHDTRNIWTTTHSKHGSMCVNIKQLVSLQIVKVVLQIMNEHLLGIQVTGCSFNHGWHMSSPFFRCKLWKAKVGDLCHKLVGEKNVATLNITMNNAWIASCV